MNEYFNVFKNFSDLRGRTRRSEFWTFCCIHSLVFVAAVLGVMGYIYMEYGSFNMVWEKYIDDPIIKVMLGCIAFYTLITTVPLISLMIRRFHDSGFTGWLYVIRFVPLVCLIVNQSVSVKGFNTSIWPYYLSILIGDLLLMYFWVKDSQPGDNYWGGNPKGIESDEKTALRFRFDA